MTSNPGKRIVEHKNDRVDGFTKGNNIQIPVWHEVHETIESAVGREKEIKDSRRKMKIYLIKVFSPYGNDLYQDIL